MSENAKAKAQPERQFGELHPQCQPSREEGIQGISRGYRNERVSSCGEAGNWGNISQLANLLGGIIEQLLESEQERFEEIEECIDLYAREREKALRRIKKLKQLQAIALSDKSLDDLATSSKLDEEE